MLSALLGLLIASIALAQGPTPELTRAALTRLEQEANRFERNAHRFVGIETLRQTQPEDTRYGKGPRGTETKLPEDTHEIVSEYTYVSTDEPGGSLKEVRLVLTVDGMKWKRGKKDLSQLANQIGNREAKNRAKTMESYEEYGLRGFLSDAGQLILLFARGGMEKHEFRYDRIDGASGHGPVWVYKYQQIDGGHGLTIYGGKEPIHQRLHGEVWVRPSDGMPVRVTINSNHEVNHIQIRDFTAVDYEMSEWNVLLPSRIDHKQYVDAQLFVIDQFTYTKFKQTNPGPAR
jgi:hypothetical protein